MPGVAYRGFVGFHEKRCVCARGVPMLRGKPERNQCNLKRTQG